MERNHCLLLCFCLFLIDFVVITPVSFRVLKFISSIDMLLRVAANLNTRCFKAFESSSPLLRQFCLLRSPSCRQRLLQQCRRSINSEVNRGQAKTDFRRILSLALPEKYRLLAAMGLLVISSGITMAVPYAIGKIIDIIYNLDQLKEKDEETQKQLVRDRLEKVCLGLSGVFLIGGLCNFGRVYLMRVSGQNITAALRNKLFSSIVKQDTAFFDKNKTGELINRCVAMENILPIIGNHLLLKLIGLSDHKNGFFSK